MSREQELISSSVHLWVAAGLLYITAAVTQLSDVVSPGVLGGGDGHGAAAVAQLTSRTRRIQGTLHPAQRSTLACYRWLGALLFTAIVLPATPEVELFGPRADGFCHRCLRRGL